MIEFKKLSASYGKKAVLKDLDLTAENGKITIILGKNGSGKSTLFRTLTGLLNYSGSALIDGKEISKARPSERGKLLAIMPQQLARPQITVRELVACGRQPYVGFSGVLSKADNEAVERAMAATQTASFADTAADKISGGELQRAYLAMIMAQETENVALDEPCAHLDPEYESRTAGFLKSAAKEGKAILAIYHNINEAVEIADKIAVMDGGELIFTGSAEEFTASSIPESLFSLKRYESFGENQKKRIFFA